MLWYRYILFDWDKSLFGFRHTRRNRRLQFYASYMNVITPHPTPPHPFTQVTWTLLHPTPPHPTPFPPRGTPAPKGIYI